MISGNVYKTVFMLYQASVFHGIPVASHSFSFCTLWDYKKIMRKSKLQKIFYAFLLLSTVPVFVLN